MTDEDALLAGIRSEPKDDLRRLVYADWLDERGDDESRAKAEYLRLEVHVSGLSDDHPERDGLILNLRGLALSLTVDWKSVVAKVPIEKCGGDWRFECPKRWSELETYNPGVRFCAECRQFVYYCESVEQAWQMFEGLGRYVVIDLGARREEGDMEPIAMSISYGPETFTPRTPTAATAPPPGFLHRLWQRLTGR